MNNKKKQKTDERTYYLNQIYFYLTRLCNLRCRHCWIQPKYQTEEQTYPSLPLKLFRSIIQQAKPLGLSSVKLTGGEPLLHPQINEILDFIQKEDLTLNMETNGTLCTTELASKMAECKNASVSVSMDGADAETHEWVRGVEGCFDESVQGIKNLVKAKFRPQIIMTVMQRNRDQLEKLVRKAEEWGAGSVKFNVLQPTGRGEKMHEAGETLSIEELVSLGHWVEETLSAKTKLRLYYSHPPAFRALGKMFGPKGDGCSVCGIKNILGVLADGSYALCGIGETVPELVFGHAESDRLKDVWEKDSVLTEIREGLPQRLKGICGDCLMKGLCLGSCIAQNYYTSRDLWAPFWFCERAREAGIFPKTRIRPTNK